MFIQEPKMKQANIIKIGGTSYRLVVFRVNTRKEDGTPDQCTMVEDLDTVELSENPDENHFFTAYIQKTDYKEHAGEIPTI